MGFVDRKTAGNGTQTRIGSQFVYPSGDLRSPIFPHRSLAKTSTNTLTYSAEMGYTCALFWYLAMNSSNLLNSYA